MSESHVPAPGARDANDEKIMATSKGNAPGRVIEASNTTLNEYKNSPIEAYYEFPSSETVSVETYSNRMGKIVEALGCKDSAKG